MSQSIRLHLPHPHIAQRFADAFEHALHHGRPAKPAPPRIVPAADDWPEWHWEDQR